MLVQCWASVVDGGPTLSQHWLNVFAVFAVFARLHPPCALHLV